MNRLLKPLIAVMFLASIVALALGIQLFEQRELLKSRVVGLEGGVAHIADALRTDLDRAQLRDPADLPGQTARIAVAADTLYEDLDYARQDLEGVRKDLDDAQADQAVTRAELADARVRVNDLNGSLEALTARHEKSEAERITLLARQNEWKTRLETLENQVVDAEVDLLAKTKERDYWRDEVVRITQGKLLSMGEDVVGTVIFTNPDWNYVILQVGSGAGLKPNAEMLIHADRELVGRLRVRSVKENMAVADVLEQMPAGRLPRKGDQAIPLHVRPSRS